MEGWKEYKLGEICTKIGSGATPKGGKEAYLGGETSLIRSQNVMDFSFSWDGLALINEEQASKLNSVEIRKGDVLLNITGDSVARACLVPDSALPARVNQHVSIVRGDTTLVLNDYILYFLQFKKSFLLSLSQGGATRNALTKGMIEDLTIPLPPLPKQTEIVAVLKSLDDKIEVNRRINENLEAQAQALFKSWFVDFEPFRDGEFVESELGMIPKGWKVSEMQEIVSIKRGGSPRPIQDFLSDKGFRWLKISDATSTNSPYIFDIKEKIKESGITKTVFLKKGSLVLSNSATPGIPKILGVDTCVHDGWLYFPQSNLSKFFLFLLFKSKRDFLLSQGNGSVFTNLKTDIVKTMKIILPPSNILEKFDKVTESLFNKMEVMAMESRRLATLRDTLLPRLMSGELKVNEIEKSL